ncbi:hypothetical protein D3C85_1105840 [compost metagenome]
MGKIVLFVCLLMQLSSLAQSSKQFDKTKMEFKGSKADQAKLLLRTVKMWGKIEQKVPSIDTVFLNFLNNEPEISKEKLRFYLKKHSISDNEICGSIDSDISNIMLNGKKVFAKYFVIHDVSTPAFLDKFPVNINESTWSKNKLNSWNWPKGKEPAHGLITRTGLSKTLNDFEKGWRATKFENNIGVSCRGLFLHVELLQPRVYPPGTEVSAPVAPTPGFTNLQYKRLALLYVCAGIRKDEWLIPAFHVNIDEGLKDGHDDPQNFELSQFTDEVLSLVTQIKKI